MPRDRLSFRQRDITAAFKAARAAGVSVARVEVRKDGTIVIIPGEPVVECTDPDADPETLAALKAVEDAKI